jgi:hypothetical protein
VIQNVIQVFVPFEFLTQFLRALGERFFHS